MVVVFVWMCHTDERTAVCPIILIDLVVCLLVLAVWVVRLEPKPSFLKPTGREARHITCNTPHVRCASRSTEPFRNRNLRAPVACLSLFPCFRCHGFLPSAALGRSADAARNQHKMMGRPRAVFKSFTRAVSRLSLIRGSMMRQWAACLPAPLSCRIDARRGTGACRLLSTRGVLSTFRVGTARVHPAVHRFFWVIPCHPLSCPVVLPVVLRLCLYTQALVCWR